jgi:hypothetical protein
MGNAASMQPPSRTLSELRPAIIGACKYDAQGASISSHKNLVLPSVLYRFASFSAPELVMVSFCCNKGADWLFLGRKIALFEQKKTQEQQRMADGGFTETELLQLLPLAGARPAFLPAESRQDSSYFCLNLLLLRSKPDAPVAFSFISPRIWTLPFRLHSYKAQI